MGVRPPTAAAPRTRHPALALAASAALLPLAWAGMCPGSFQLDGHGAIALTNAGANTPGAAVGRTELQPGGKVVAHMSARTYFADSCADGVYSNSKYSAMKLLGKVLRYTTDVSSAGCGCNAAFYLVSMKQNSQISSCSDYYCDANKVCGVACTEVDIQEASKRAWHSTLHGASDSSGVGGGYGGGASWNGPRDFTSGQYGPGSSCVDTMRPIDVAVSFPTNPQGQLQAMQVTLTQQGRNCPLTINLASYANMGEISAALAAGMTPVISYWKSGDMLWMDGKGADGQGPCAADTQRCGDNVKFYNFSLEYLPGHGPGPARKPAPAPTKPPPQPVVQPAPAPQPAPVPARTAPPPPALVWPAVTAKPVPSLRLGQSGNGTGKKANCTGSSGDCRLSRCCKLPGATCFEKNQWWASCKWICTPGIDPFDPPDNQQPWTCKVLGPTAGGAAHQAFVNVVLRLPAGDLPDGPQNGAEVGLKVGDHQIRAQVVDVRHGAAGSGHAAGSTTHRPYPRLQGARKRGGGGFRHVKALLSTLIVAGLAMAVAGSAVLCWSRHRAAQGEAILSKPAEWLQCAACRWRSTSLDQPQVTPSLRTMTRTISLEVPFDTREEPRHMWRAAPTSPQSESESPEPWPRGSSGARGGCKGDTRCAGLRGVCLPGR